MSYAGDITPEQAWTMLEEHSDAVLVDCRTDAEWRFVGTADISALGRDVVYVEWNRGDGTHNDGFVDDLIAGGVLFSLYKTRGATPPASTHHS